MKWHECQEWWGGIPLISKIESDSQNIRSDKLSADILMRVFKKVEGNYAN